MADGGPLKDKVAIVTGASSGIGRATAAALADAGASVVVAARRAHRLAELTEEIETSGGRALAVPCDVTEAAEARHVVSEALGTFGRLDVLVNNAGVMRVAPIPETRLDDWSRMVDVNINGILNFVAAALPHMIESGSGHIVNVGSVAGRRPFPGGGVYAATKFAVRALSWAMHLELGAAHGIRVTDIQPGLVSTELLDGSPQTAAWKEAWSERRMLQADDVARAILFATTSPDHVSVSEILVRPTDQPT